MSTKSEGIQILNKTLRDLNEALRYTSVYNVWVRFTVGGLTINTSDPNNNYFVSLENIINGSGQANMFTITIAFIPRMGPGLTDTIEDADYIDVMLMESNRDCELQYGYSYGPAGLISPLYHGMVLDYSNEIRDGMLYYTITGYSGVVAVSNTKYNFDVVKGKRPTEVAFDAINAKLNNSESSEKNLVGYEAAYEDGVEGSDLYPPDSGSGDKIGPESSNEKTSIGAMSDVTLFEYINSVLSMAVYSKDADKINTDDKNNILNTSTYYYRVSDTDKKIYIGRNDPDDVDKQEDIVVFEWMDQSNSVIIDFKTEFKGAVLMSFSSQIDKDTYAIGSDGKKIENAKMISNDPSGNQAKEDAISEQMTWSEATQFSYKATLILVGVPCEIPIGAYIKIVPLIYGKPHHTGGTYMITKATDNIDSGGFITTLDLVKINSEEVKKFSEVINNESQSTNVDPPTGNVVTGGTDSNRPEGSNSNNNTSGTPLPTHNVDVGGGRKPGR